MTWTEEKIELLFSQKDFVRGKDYFRQGRVTELHTEELYNKEYIACTVTGSEAYRTKFCLGDKSVSVYCTCPRFAEVHTCKHLAAGMLAYLNRSRSGISANSDHVTQHLLREYMERAQHKTINEKKAVLTPHLDFDKVYQNYPLISLQVGFERPYVVRNILTFLENVDQHKTETYGKGLTLYHGIEQFDAQSQQLIRLLMDQFAMFRSPGDGYYSSLQYAQFSTAQKNRIKLTGSAFDRFFDIYLENTLECVSGSDTALRFTEGDPEVTLTIKRKKREAEISVATKGKRTLFGNTQSLYAAGCGQLLRCSENFLDNAGPLLRHMDRKMMVAFSDLPTFCSCILPRVQELIEIRDPDDLLHEYLPDECTPCFYFDANAEQQLLLRLTFRYGEHTFTPEGKPPKGVKRDLLVEDSARRLAEQYFAWTDGEGFTLAGDDAVFSFLTQDMVKFQEAGEVYISDRLKARRIQPSRTAVGISVSGDLLKLNIDTGGFPPEELEALYQSLLRKRRYHRLADGRYLELNGSACETLAELSHMLQLSSKKLKNGEVELPAFRALYLDDLLADGKDGIQVRRDSQFRAMVRRFRALSEGEYTLPAEMEDVLRPYQQVGFQWLKTLESCGFGGILADEMGLGKTVQMIAFLSTVPKKVTGLGSLVVCPASLVLNWRDELERFAPHLSVSLIMGTAAERRRRMDEGGNADVWVTSYELLRQDIDRYQGSEFYCCILDEGQHIKNRSTQLSRAVKQIDCRQRFVLTGTPIENRLSELWNLFDFLMPGYLFTHSGFLEKLEKPVVKSGDQEAIAQLRRLVQPFMLRRLKQDVLKELPPKIEHVHRISLSEEERKIYAASAHRTLRSMEAGAQSKLAVLAALTQLRQICCTPELCFENYTGPSSKLDAAIELCSGMVENGHQILFFSQFTTMLDLVRSRLDALHISNFTLQGSTPKEKRAQLVKAFNAGEASVFLISLKAGGTGLNLTAADVVIHYDPWWNLAAQDQATDRSHRIGQQSRVQVYKLIAEDTIEERIMELQHKKSSLMDAVSDTSGAGILDMSKEDLLSLLK